MKKKGFTLVELLAVIAILAILVIIALPNIMDLFNQAKKNSFANEVKEIYKTAQTQWMSDALNGGSEVYYGRGASGPLTPCTSGALSLSGRTDIQYIVHLDSTGAVTSLAVADGTYYYDNDETLDEITADSISTVSEEVAPLLGFRCNPSNTSAVQYITN